MQKYIIPALIGLLSIGGGTYYGIQEFGADKREKITFDPATAQVVRWDKPKTDAEWAEDVKVESFDIKSTGKLTEMRDVHAAKLERVLKGMDEIFNCMECIKYDIKTAHPEYTQAEIDAEYADQLAKANWEVEKLKQSVERMDNELRLRDKGFVVVEGEVEEGLFGGSVDAKYVRKIND